MLVRLIAAPHTEFHVEHSLASILLAIPNTPIEIPPAPAPRALSPQSTFTINESLTVGGPVLHATCRNCKNVMNAWGPTAHVTQKFHHCGIAEDVPAEIQRAYSLAYKNATEERPAPKRKPGSVAVL
jgi:hypothetical protein